MFLESMTVLSQHPIISTILIIIASIIIFIGCMGNILVIWIVVSSNFMWTATNILIANLALADVFVLACDLPFSLHYQLTNKWVYGAFLCRALSMAFGVMVFVSTYTLTAIAVDRYVLIVKPLSQKLSPRKAVVVGAMILLLSVVVTLPVGLYSEVQEHKDPSLGIDYSFCSENWPEQMYRMWYTVLTWVAQFLIPLVLIALLYYKIFKKIKQRMSSLKSGQSSKTHRMLVSVVMVFVITWTPYQLITPSLEFFSLFGDLFKLLDISLRLLAMSSSCINPILYGYMNDNFHNGFMKAIACFLRKQGEMKMRRNKNASVVQRGSQQKELLKSVCQADVTKLRNLNAVPNIEVGSLTEVNSEINKSHLNLSITCDQQQISNVKNPNLQQQQQ